MAHQTGLSYLKITKQDKENFSVVYKKPLEDAQSEVLQINFPSYCYRKTAITKSIENGFIIDDYILHCTNGTLVDARIWIKGLESSDKGVLVEYNEGGRQQRLLRASNPFILIQKEHSSKESSWNIFTEYMGLGFSHILTGYDHLLFLVALLFLARTSKRLLYMITAFTISHSMSLGLTALGLISVPITYVEAMIALSIIILFREIIVEDSRILSTRHNFFIVLLFGLLHGLGFASVLSNIGLPSEDVLVGLLAFNLGIEFGQLLFVFVLGSIIFLIFKLVPIYKRNIKLWISYFMGGIASFWLIERIISF